MQGYEARRLLSQDSKNSSSSIDEFSDVKEDDKDKFVENVKFLSCG